MPLIGESPPRPDGWAKVSGSARFVDDDLVDGTWHGATLRSPHAHARIVSIRWQPSRAPSGAVHVTASSMTASTNGVRLLDDSWPILARRVVRHVGEPVALVAAPTRLEALRALDAFDVEYEPLPAHLVSEQASEEPLPAHLVCPSRRAKSARSPGSSRPAATWTRPSPRRR